MADSAEDMKKAKIQALRNLRDKGFYEPKTDNPEGLDLDEGSRTPEQAANAPNTPDAQNRPILNVNPMGQPQGQFPTPTPLTGQSDASNPQATMQQNPQNLLDALKQKTRQQQLQDLIDAARQ